MFKHRCLDWWWKGRVGLGDEDRRRDEDTTGVSIVSPTQSGKWTEE